MLPMSIGLLASAEAGFGPNMYHTVMSLRCCNDLPANPPGGCFGKTAACSCLTNLQCSCEQHLQCTLQLRRSPQVVVGSGQGVHKSFSIVPLRACATVTCQEVPLPAPYADGWQGCSTAVGSICSARCTYGAIGTGFTAECSASGEWVVTGGCQPAPYTGEGDGCFVSKMPC
jgi:hypothetical protein